MVQNEETKSYARGGNGGQLLELTEVPHDSTSAFNLFLQEGVSFQDGSFTVQVRAMSGVVDQGGGPIWRVVDADNYYICRANPLENNFRLYVVERGVRRQLASVEVELETGTFYPIQVTHQGEHIECALGGGYATDPARIEAHDSTFRGPGAVGLWTKADACTRFLVPDAWVVNPDGD